MTSVTVDSISPDGTDFKINFVKTGPDTATIMIITTQRTAMNCLIWAPSEAPIL
jgi:hypothetical protein